MSAHDAWLKTIKFVLDNWGKIVVVITAIGGYATGGVQYAEKVEKVNENTKLIKRLEALEVGPIQVIVPPQSKTLTRSDCEAIAKKAVNAHIRSRMH